MPETKLDWPKLMEEALTAPGNLGQTYSRFHDYSITNEMLFFMQGIHEPVASRSTWKRLGRTILTGHRPKKVIVPVLINEREPESEQSEAAAPETAEEKKERITRLIGFKLIHGVFPLSATEGKDVPERKLSGWNWDTMLDIFGITEEPFVLSNGNIQGYSHDLRYAINPLAVDPDKTRFHEVAHILFGHTLKHGLDGEAHPRAIQEFQAEATAYIVMNELGVLRDETASVSRAYIKHYLGEQRPPDQAIRRVFTVADRILKAGRIDPQPDPQSAN